MSLEPKHLTEEKSLWRLYLLSYKFPTSKFNVGTTLFLMGLLAFYGLSSKTTQLEISTVLRETLKLGGSLAPSILGFLIAGFTIFVTVTKSEIFEAMARMEYENSGESYLKYNLSAFVLAFAHYVSYLAIIVLMSYFAQPGGPLSKLLLHLSNALFPSASISVYKYLTVLGLVLFGGWTWYLVMLLKSFIYNTYQVITTTVRFELEDKIAKSSTPTNTH